MKRILNILIALILSVSMLLLSGCAKKISLARYKSIKSSSSDDIVIAGSKYTMRWDNEKKVIRLKDDLTGTEWSTTPEYALNNDVLQSGKKNNPQTEAALIVTYYDTEKYIQNTLISSSDAIKSGKVYAKKTSDDTISVVYDFSKSEITVVIEYKLTEKGITVSLNPQRISEGNKKIVTNVSIAPFFCALKNNTDDSYIFVPSGCGALIYPKIKTHSSQVISDGVFGEDLAVNNEFKTTQKANVNLPVYGSIENSKGIMAVIEEGASSCSIVSSSGNESLGYTTVYADFAIRGYEIVDQPSGVQASSNVSKVAKVYSNPSKQQVRILFIPLEGNEISYVTMAKEYREYLIDKYELKPKTAKESVSLRILGGIMSTEFSFGIPHSALKPLTNLKKTEKIIDEMEKAYGGKLVYNLDGYGESGLDVGEVAGGYSINNRLGSQSSLKKLFKKYNSTETNVFMNFDIIRYNNSGSGFRTNSDAAIAATQKRITKYFYNIATYNEETSFESYKLLKRSQLPNALNKLLKYLDKNDIKNVSLDTLSNKLYSDYSNERYYCKSGIDEIESMYRKLSNDKYKIFSSNANVYSAVFSDYIDNVPLYSSAYDAYDVDVPFYQIVFSGIVPMYSENWGGAKDDTEMLLKSIESGIGISLSVIGQYDSEILSSPQKTMYSCGSDNLKYRMEELNKKSFFETNNKIKNAQIIDHVFITDNIRKTVFDNGVQIFVNYSGEKFENDEISIDPRSYALKGDYKQ